MTTDFAAAPDAVRHREPAERGPVGQVVDRFVPRHLQSQLVRFAAIGVGSTVAYALLYLLLRLVTGAFLANALALLLTAIANTALNRRVTFEVRGNDGLASDHAVGLLAFGAGLALTTGALAVLHTTGSSNKGLELVVLMAANVVATLLRFVALKLKIGR